MAKVWSGVQIAVQSALATALPISAITKANPAVASYTGTDPVNGDYLYLSSIQGMYQLDERVVRAANVNGAGNTVELEGVNSTAFDTFTSGNLQVITFGTTLSLITDITVSGGEFEDIDTTTIHDLVRVVQPGVASNLNFAMTAQWDPASTALQALKTASDGKSRRAIRFTFADGTKWVTTGFIGCSLAPTGSAQQLVTTPITIKANANASQAYAT
jgi:hypothetical protein